MKVSSNAIFQLSVFIFVTGPFRMESSHFSSKIHLSGALRTIESLRTNLRFVFINPCTWLLFFFISDIPFVNIYLRCITLQRLLIARQFNDLAAERRAFSNLGNAHVFLGEFEIASEYYKYVIFALKCVIIAVNSYERQAKSFVQRLFNYQFWCHRLRWISLESPWIPEHLWDSSSPCEVIFLKELIFVLSRVSQRSLFPVPVAEMLIEVV